MMVAPLIGLLVLAPPQRPSTGQGPAAGVSPRTAEDIHNQMEAYLGSIDTPIADAAWRGLGPQAGPMLEQVFADKGQLPTRRARSLEAFGIVDPAGAAAKAPPIARSEAEPYVVRAAALRALAKALEPKELRASLRPVLTNARDVRVRADAADLLASRADDCPGALAQVARESPAQRGHFHAALRHCGK